jgi:hypothetical protein
MLSVELTNQRTIPLKRTTNLYGNATWKKNAILEAKYNKKWNANRLHRMTHAEGYQNTNISMPYIDPNSQILDFRLVKENNVYDYWKTQTTGDRVDRLFNYYSAPDNAPPRRLPLYGSFNAVALQ